MAGIPPNTGTSPTALAEPINLPAAEVNEAVYLAVAAAKNDAGTDILAGVTYHIVQAHPGV